MEYSPKWKRITEDLTSKFSGNQFKKGDLFYSLRELSQNYNVSEITSRRVLSELSRQNLIKQIQGKGTFVIKSSVSHKIYLVIPEHFDINGKKHSNIIWAETIHGITRQSERTNTRIEISSLFPAGEECRLIITSVNRIINNKKIYDLAVNNKFICVALFACEPIEGISTVRSDLKKGAYLAVSHLISRGHQRIGFITGKVNDVWFAPRFDGYYQALRDNNILLDLNLIKETSGVEPEEDQEAAKQLLSLSAPITAVVTANDVRALHVLEYCKKTRINVPKDLAIVGFDNSPETSVSDPPLTVIDNLWRKRGEEAVKLLLQLAEEDSPRPQDIVIEPRLVARQSS